jgi:pyrroline-5-carboxylate reductase
MTSLADLIAPDRPLVLAGAGKMGGALLSGWLGGGLEPSSIRVIDPAPSAETAELLARSGIVAMPQPSGDGAGVLVVAVKPQVIGAVLPPLSGTVRNDTIVVSIAAGITMETLNRGLGRGRIVRTMPNTPAQIGRGITVAVGSGAIDQGARALVTALFEAVGEVAWVEDEALMDAVTAVSGSGPAYVFLLAECLAEAGAAAGLAPELAYRLANATVSGAGALLAQSGEDPALLRKNVTSPGGTTAAALDILMAPGGLAPLMRNAVLAAKKRAAELAR